MRDRWEYSVGHPSPAWWEFYTETLRPPPSVLTGTDRPVQWKVLRQREIQPIEMFYHVDVDRTWHVTRYCHDQQGEEWRVSGDLRHLQAYQVTSGSMWVNISGELSCFLESMSWETKQLQNKIKEKLFYKVQKINKWKKSSAFWQINQLTFKMMSFTMARL